MNDAFNSLSLIVQSSQLSKRAFLTTEDANVKAKEQFKIKSYKRGIIPQESLRRMKNLLTKASFNLLASYFERFCKDCTDIFSSNSLEAFVMSSWSIVYMMSNVSREHSVCFKTPENEHYYIWLTLNFFKYFLSGWMRSLHDFYILYSLSIYAPFRPFQTVSPLNFINESYEESASFNKGQLEPSFQFVLVEQALKMVAYTTRQ